jgi:acyl-homoserine lactone acylase PvdQ
MRITTQNLFFRTVLLTAIFFLSSCSIQDESGAELKRLSNIAERITIIRDDYGVPHIYGKTDADAVFGLLYAQAEDDFPRVERNYIWAIGRLAEIEGEKAIYSDLRARLFMTTEEAKIAYASAPEWLQLLCQSFADGLNYYLASNPKVTPKLITHFEPWMPMFFFEGSIGGDIEQIPLGGIESFYGDDENFVVNNNLETNVSEFIEPKGSNGFAISGEHTASGNSMLLINPHTSFYFRGEVHVVSEEGLNAYGAVTWGQFFVYQGFNENTGWMHTSTRLDFMDEFIEDIDKIDGNLVYRYGSDYRPVTTKEVTLRYKDGENMAERTFPMYRTHHGPVTHKIDGKWVATKINWDPVNALKQSFIRTKNKGHKGFREMMDIRTNSSNNTVYADSDGNIAYYHGNFVPKRNTKFDFTQPVDGSNPETDWQGIHEVDEIVTLLNPENGWLQNCNSTPFTAAGEYSPNPEDYAIYMAPDLENFRGLHAVDLLSNMSDLTLDGLITMAYDPYLPAFETLLPGLISAFDQLNSDNKSHSAAINVLREWDYKTASDSIAMTIAHFYGLHYLAQGKNPELLRGNDRIIYFGSDSPNSEKIAIFEKTIATLEDDFGGWNIPWGEVNRLQRITGDIDQPHDDDAPSLPIGMASGKWGALAAFGATQYPNTKRIYGYRGNSFVAVVEFGDKVKAKSILAGGQSGDPDSPHFYDQAVSYKDVKFKDVAYYNEDVMSRAIRQYNPGQ